MNCSAGMPPRAMRDYRSYKVPHLRPIRCRSAELLDKLVGMPPRAMREYRFYEIPHLCPIRCRSAELLDKLEFV